MFDYLRIFLEDDHILWENLYIILTSMEMTAVFQVLAIFHLALVMPRCWLVSNIQNLTEEDWFL